ncbi:RNA polymerase recycling motor HelD [Lentilactobacillus buchneri]|uniref:UvrD-like helicase ATP-binding domain-containing protein n=1 Tax=Lentilactobacillus buchneri DSM 20057 TaxID=1423728 RepID=A0A4R5NPL3_LENBU|nr:RNA polymerase recycling motor HelD [Lentilactobacillus buchneri]KRK67562.1 DNA helicase [Lentilactobacillus buchneri DSM 20057]MCT2881403.1 ATP-dependent DNA helicase [Lentilactobacillus buchneri]MCT3253376.1 ATP-dependent DNA helicase [Lentilactobacillus buchneri]MCT3547969.1 ATP-dependent DNA helicase [Lentilactobacillus buchneri]MCT3555583.1 ATP-dependent DNA helicase [Lentilactobacillus buchneri]
MADNIKTQEQHHLDHVIDEIHISQKDLEQKIKATKRDVKDINRNFNNDVRLKTETYSGMMETAMSIRQQQQMLSERENRQEHAARELGTLNKLEQNPYFARIDFREGDEKRDETIYIGMASFTDRPDHYLIYDWRAPISSIYYNGGIGDVSYMTPDGEQTVDVKLKRQFQIENSKIKTVFDTEEVVGDQMLLDALSNRSDTKMKSIVTTIQKEQNQIIRDTDSDLLFVQGSAGSGKTAAVLQRVAFLLYQYRGNLHSGQIILFSPNQLFNDYINQVLPELGEQNMVQMTFYQYSSHRLPSVQVETLSERFTEQLDKTAQKLTDVKGSLDYFRAVSAYANHLNKEDMRFRNLMFNGDILIPKEKIAEIYYGFNENYNLRNRLESTKEELMKILNRKIHVEMRKKWVEDAVQNLSKEEIQQFHAEGEEEILNADKEFKFLARRIVIKSFRKVQRQISRNHWLSINNQFVHMLKEMPKILNLADFGISNELWAEEIKATVGRLKKGRLSLADASSYIYLYDLMTGKRGDKDIRYLFIDEVQDYSAFQLAFLKFSFPRARFTLLGDLNQAIFTHENSRKLLGELGSMFPEDKTRVVQLTKSYRSTEQITNFTKHLLTNGENIIPFNRQGDLPHIYVKDGVDAAVEQVKQQSELNLADHETTAIIGKTLKECQELSGKLAELGVKSTLIRTENQRLVKGIIVVPSYLAKGLEFDSVIMWDASKACYPDESDRQLVYTICTRAMHRLTVVAVKSLSPIFETVPQDEYELN